MRENPTDKELIIAKYFVILPWLTVSLKDMVSHKIGKIAESYQSKTPKKEEEDDAIEAPCLFSER